MSKFSKYLIIPLGLLVVAIIFFKAPTEEKTISKRYDKQLALAEKYKGFSTSDIKNLPKRDRPDLAFLQDFEMTMDPALGYPPVRRKLEAYKISKQLLKSKSNEQAAIDGVKWVERGPNNIGGRTRALMFDPNDATAKKVWAGAIGGGLWYNMDITDQRTQWQVVDDMMSNLAISTLTYDPSNTQVFYMGTGLGYGGDIQGEGIWKSDDAGASWNQLTSTNNSDFEFVQKIEVTSSGEVFANTLTGTHKSADGGETWTNVNSGRMGDMDIASDGSIYSTQGVNSSGALFKSTDEGITWTDITPESTISPRRIDVISAPSDPNVIYAVADGGSGSTDVAFMMKSDDAGATWTDMEIPLYTDQDCTIGTNHYTRGQAFFDLIMLVHPENPAVLLVGGIDIHRTTDAGATWGLVSYWTGSFCDDLVHADQHVMVNRPGYPNEAIFGNDGGVYYSADVFMDGSNPEFGSRQNGYNVTTFYSCATANELNSNYIIAGAQDNGTLMLNEVGNGFAYELTGGDGGFCFIDQDNTQIQITSTTNNSYRLSQDGGKSFFSITDDGNKGRFINPTEYDSDADVLYGTGETNEISRILDISKDLVIDTDGFTVTSHSLEYLIIDLDGRKITTIKASPFTENRLFVGVRVNNGEGQIFMVDDANASVPTVTEITGTFGGADRPGGWVSSIDVGTSDNQLLATFSNYGVSSVFETTDGGANWTDKEDNLPDIPVRWGLYNPMNTKQVLLATEIGVWSTNDISAASPNWEPTNSGLANVRCDMLKYRAADETVVVATFGRGIFTTNVFANTIDANFETKQVIGYVGVPVSFQDASLLPNDSWAWDFGDGNNSTAQNPSNTYASAGTYDISLSIDNGSDTESKVAYVTILPVKSTPYTLADGGDFESNPDDYTSKSLFNGINHWERGTPGNRLATPSSGVNAWKTNLDTNIEDLGYDYSSALYTPAFDLSDESKDYTLKFKKSMENGYCNSPHGLQVQFSVDGGSNWFTLGSSHQEYGSVNWYNRGDNTGCSLEDQLFIDKIGWNASNVNDTDNSVENENTEYKLNAFTGESNISFRFVSAVSTGSGEDDNGSVYDRDGFMIDDFELTAEDAGAEFTASNTVAFKDQQIQFTYQSNGAETFAWDFGDGITSDQENPIHGYSNPGLFTVALTITSPAGSVTETKAEYIQVLANRTVPYTLADGGNFDVNQTDFGVENIAGTKFELGKSSVNGKDGTASGDFAWVTGLNESEYADESEARLFSPVFGFSTAGEYTLSFKSKHVFEANWDGFIVEYSIDLGQSWVKLNDTQESGWYNQISDPQSVFGVSVPIFSGNTNGEFTQFSTNVSFLFPNEAVIFRFLFKSDANTVDAGMALDDFELDGPSPGPATPGFSFEGITGCEGQVVTFTNTSTGTIESLEWDFGDNADPATAIGAGPHVVTYNGTSGTSSVSLTINSSVSGTLIETKTDIISHAANHAPTFEINGDEMNITVLTASDGGDSYQWFFNGDSIKTDGASQIYNALEKGNYYVSVDIGGCVNSSENENVFITSLQDDTFERSISIYPNPTQGKLKIAISNENTGSIIINIYNLLGAKVESSRIVKDAIESNIELDLTQFQSGTYLLEVISENGKATKRIMVK